MHLELWIIDGRTGESNYISYSGDEEAMLRGARKSVGVVIGDSRIQPYTSSEGVEPLPVVINNNLYWMVRVIPSSSSRITAVAFYNAQNGDIDVIEVEEGSTEKVKSFIRTGKLDQQPTVQNNKTIIRGFTIEIKREGGSKNNITINSGDTVKIKK